MYDMTIRLQADGSCLYEQIYEHIKKEIRDGKLLVGERLPSTRSLAEYLQVARSTVDYAYGQLLAEGYIESKPCKGYFVCPMEVLAQMEENMGAPGRRAPAGEAGIWPGREGAFFGRAGIWPGRRRSSDGKRQIPGESEERGGLHVGEG